MRDGTRRVGIMVVLGGFVAGTALDARAIEATKPNAEAQPAPISADPQQTSASFGDWVVRCDRPGGATAPKVCEVAQSLIIKGQQAPIAQIAFGQNGNGPLLLTVLLPVNIAFDKQPTLGTGPDDAQAATLAFRRCGPGGCLADTKIDQAFLKELRGAQKPGRLTFTDATERGLALPVSFRGLAQALDNLAKEKTGKL